VEKSYIVKVSTDKYKQYEVEQVLLLVLQTLQETIEGTVQLGSVPEKKEVE
jgi:hypothetical protein